ncbi:MAG: hypothetical protein AB1425_08265, partial [Actinomycetota bacterium]
IVFSFGSCPSATGAPRPARALLYGVAPVIIAIAAHVLWSLPKTAMKGPLTSAALYLLTGIGKIPLLWRRARSRCWRRGACWCGSAPSGSCSAAGL